MLFAGVAFTTVKFAIFSGLVVYVSPDFPAPLKFSSGANVVPVPCST